MPATPSTPTRQAIAPAGSRQEGAGMRLVDDWQKHLKFNGREPRTLEELAIARADYEHSRRRAEIKAMGGKLAQLDPLLPALAAAGIRLAMRDISTFDGGKTLRIWPVLVREDGRLYTALIALGFREIERQKNCTNDDSVDLKLGRSLVLRINAPRAEPAPATATEATGSPA